MTTDVQASGGVTRRLHLTTIAAGVAGALTACGPLRPAEAPGARSVAKVSIEWWTGWGVGGLAAQTFDQVAAAANQEGRTYEVRHLPQTGVAKKLAEVVAAGSPPDVEGGNLSYPEFWARGLVEPVDKWLGKSRALKRDDLFATSWQYGSYKGKTYGVPALEGFIRWGMAANEDLLAKRGFDPAKLPTNWDDLYGWHRELTILDPATKAIAQLGLDPRNAMGGSASGGDPFFWGPAWGFKHYDEGKDQFNLANVQLEEALATIKRFYDAAGGYPAVQEFRKGYGTWTGPKSGIVVGTEAMQINGPWTPGSLAKNAPEKRYAYTWPPVAPARKGKKLQSTGGHFAVLPKGSPHPEPGFEFIEFLTGERAHQIIFDGLGWIGARKSFLPKINASQYRGLDFYIRSATTADDMWAAAVNPIEGFFADRWKEQADAVMLGQTSPKSALLELQRLCTEELRKLLGK